MIPKTSIAQAAKQFFPEAITIRSHLHQYPELSFQEYKTSAFIQEKLKTYNIAFQANVVETGIVALIEGKNPQSKTVLLRADMDALPIQEKNEVVYASKNEGIMHACGHDVHTTCVLGAAKILNELKHEWEGTVKVIFQPGEEVLPGGAKLMLEAGILNQPKVEAAIAQHVFPSMEAGKVGFRSGMYMASTDELYLTVKGKGGHAAMPAEYKNPLIIASKILVAIEETFMNPTINNLNQGIPTVLAFGKIEGKGATNVIPDEVKLEGTFRTMDESWRKSVHEQLAALVNKVAGENGGEAHLNIKHGYPFLVNDQAVTERARKAAKDYLGAENVEELPLRMTAEDFAFISQEVPSCFYRLGTGNASKGIVAGVHTPYFDIDEKALETGVGLMAWLALSELNT
jgi:amidohydrolase